MNNDKNWKKALKPKRYSLIFATIIAFASVLSAGVSTFAWFQANAAVQIQTNSTSADITVSAPEDLVTFYYFKGNGTPGGDYTGYSKQDAAFGNTTNIIKSDGSGFSTDGGSSFTAFTTFENAWGEINVDDTSTGSGVASKTNCFNLSKMRPGCYYSFLAETRLSTSTLTASFSWNHVNGTGHSTSPKRYVTNTVYPVNLLMAVHGYCKELDDNTTDARTYISNTVGIASGLSLSEKISYTPSGTGTTSQPFTLLNGATTSTNKYIYFTVYMGKSDKSDALVYASNSDGINYYTVSSSGSYAPYDGLKSTLSSVAVS